MEAGKVAAVVDRPNLALRDALTVGQMVRRAGGDRHVAIDAARHLTVEPETSLQTLAHSPYFREIKCLDYPADSRQPRERRCEHAADEEMRVNDGDGFVAQRPEQRWGVAEIPERRSPDGYGPDTCQRQVRRHQA
jgi:hypothetical protein